MSFFAPEIDFPTLQQGSDHSSKFAEENDDATAKTEEDVSDSTVETGERLESKSGPPSKPERQSSTTVHFQQQTQQQKHEEQQQVDVGSDASAGSADNSEAAKYGYEDAPPTPHRRRAYHYDASILPRRSSLRNADPEVRAARRESIGSTSTQVIEVRVRGERFPVERRRSIDFYPKAKVEMVTRVTDLVSEEELWLQEHEMAVMKEQRRDSVRKMKRLQKANLPTETINEEESFRGLEKYVDKAGRGRKMEGWDAVLWEQEQQELYGKFDDQKIADLYKKTTGPSPEKAVQLAKQDAADIESYLMTPRTTKLMMRRTSM
jgi:hypothetical protein